MFEKLKQKKEAKNVAKQEEDLYLDRLNRCRPLAYKFLQILAENTPPIGDTIDKTSGKTKEEINQAYIKIAGLMLKEMLKADIYFSEKVYPFQLLAQAFEFSKEKVQMSLDRNLSKAETKLFGKEDIDLRLSDIDRILKE